MKLKTNWNKWYTRPEKNHEKCFLVSMFWKEAFQQIVGWKLKKFFFYFDQSCISANNTQNKTKLLRTTHQVICFLFKTKTPKNWWKSTKILCKHIWNEQRKRDWKFRITFVTCFALRVSSMLFFSFSQAIVHRRVFPVRVYI